MDNFDPISLLIIMFGIAMIVGAILTILWYLNLWPPFVIYLMIKSVSNCLNWLFNK